MPALCASGTRRHRSCVACGRPLLCSRRRGPWGFDEKLKWNELFRSAWSQAWGFRSSTAAVRRSEASIVTERRGVRGGQVLGTAVPLESQLRTAAVTRGCMTVRTQAARERRTPVRADRSTTRTVKQAMRRAVALQQARVEPPAARGQLGAPASVEAGALPGAAVLGRLDKPGPLEVEGAVAAPLRVRAISSVR